jgi:hypothetical protein
MKSAGLKMQRFLARHWLAEPTAAASARSHQQAQDQRLPQRRSGEPGKKEEEVSAELAKKKPGRTYNFKPAVLMHFRFAAVTHKRDPCPSLPTKQGLAQHETRRVKRCPPRAMTLNSPVLATVRGHIGCSCEKLAPRLSGARKEWPVAPPELDIDETRRIQKLIDDEFGKVEPESWR